MRDRFLLGLRGGQLALALRGFRGVRLSTNRLGTLVLEAFDFRTQLGERTGHEDMGRAELFQLCDRRLPVPRHEFLVGVLHRGTRQALVGNR